MTPFPRSRIQLFERFQIQLNKTCLPKKFISKILKVGNPLLQRNLCLNFYFSRDEKPSADTPNRKQDNAYTLPSFTTIFFFALKKFHFTLNIIILFALTIFLFYLQKSSLYSRNKCLYFYFWVFFVWKNVTFTLLLIFIDNLSLAIVIWNCLRWVGRQNVMD